MSKKYFSLILLVPLLILLIGISIYIIGCGEGVVLDEPSGPGAFYIVSRSPTIGATDVATTENIVITFSNPLLTKEVMTNLMITTWEGHTAGLPFLGTSEVIWSNNYRTATVSIENWPNNPNGRVRFIMATNFLDIHGQTLPMGTWISDYGLVGAPPVYKIEGRVTGGTFGKTVLVIASTTTETEPTQFIGWDFGITNPYDYAINGLPTGEYYILALRDEDDSGLEPTTGDYFGIYPNLASPSSIEVPPSTLEVDFTLQQIP